MEAELMLKTEALAAEIATQATTIEELNGVMRSLMKSALERMLDTEIDVHLGRRTLSVPSAAPAVVSSPQPTATGAGKNRRNGHRPKTMPGDMGKLPWEIPRDRDGTFEPQLIAKHQRRLAGFDEKILTLYAKGMTTRDIQELIQELYGVDVSPTLISEVTADLDAEVKAWQTRRLDRVCPNRESAIKLVYMAIHEASKKWTMPIRSWKASLNHFAVMFEDRMPK